jgi:hypothetical protein
VQRRHALSETRRQHLLQFQKSADRRFFNPGYAAAGTSSQAERDGHSLIVIEQKWRQGRSGPELIAARNSCCGMDWISEAAKPVYIPPQGAPGDLQPLREFGSAPVALQLE